MAPKRNRQVQRRENSSRTPNEMGVLSFLSFLRPIRPFCNFTNRLFTFSRPYRNSPFFHTYGAGSMRLVTRLRDFKISLVPLPISIRGIRTALGDMTELLQRGTRVIHEKTEENARRSNGRDAPPPLKRISHASPAERAKPKIKNNEWGPAAHGRV